MLSVTLCPVAAPVVPWVLPWSLLGASTIHPRCDSDAPLRLRCVTQYTFACDGFQFLFTHFGIAAFARIGFQLIFSCSSRISVLQSMLAIGFQWLLAHFRIADHAVNWFSIGNSLKTYCTCIPHAYQTYVTSLSDCFERCL